MSFVKDLEALCQAAGERASDVVRRTAIDLQAQMVERTPVDLGRARGAWQVGLGGINTHEGAPDKAGGATVARAQQQLQPWQPGQAIYLSNSLPYAKVLEYGLYGKPPGSANGPKTVGGYSKQAPGGMVRLAVQNYAQAVATAAQKVRGGHGRT